jgi:hypothetical protein
VPQGRRRAAQAAREASYGASGANRAGAREVSGHVMVAYDGSGAATARETLREMAAGRGIVGFVTAAWRVVRRVRAA